MVNATDKLIEYRDVRHSAESEASSYLTTDRAQVSLCFSNPIICQMIHGRKIMRVDQSAPFEFLPGQAMLIAPHMRLDISFPEASPDNPAECICIEMEPNRVHELVERINRGRVRLGLESSFILDWTRFALFRSDCAIGTQMNKLMALYRDDKSPFRDALIDLGHEELMLRILQSQARDLFLQRNACHRTTGIEAAARAMRDNPERRYSIGELSQMACMSDATFFRHFKARFGVSPTKFANECRIQTARSLLATAPVTDVAFNLGFASVEHFSRLFRQITGETPGGIRKRLQSPSAARA